MMLFDDLRDNEWALVEALFCAEPAGANGAVGRVWKRARLSTPCFGCCRPAKAGRNCRAAIRHRRLAAVASTNGKPMVRSPK